jgi:hypothetical protein
VAHDATAMAPERLSEQQLRRQRARRRILIASLVLFVAVGLSSLLGSKTDAVTASASGVTLTVTYPSITRPGLPIRWEIEVSRPGGFDGPVELHTTFDYLHLFDISNLEPDARSSTSSTNDIVYTFDPPAGNTFIVSMDGNTEPGIHEVPRATTSLVSNGQTIVAVSYYTLVVP